VSYSGVVKPAKPLQRKNPATAAKKHPLPWLTPDYPIKPWIADTGERFHTVSLSLDDGRYLAVILEDQSIRQTAKTRRAAEDAVKDAFPPKANPSRRRHQSTEDEALNRIADQRLHEPRYPIEKLLKKAAYELESQICQIGRSRHR